MEELFYLDGIEIDIIPNSIARTLQANSIGELKDRQANFSSTVKAPFTPKNIATMKYLGVTGNESRQPYVKIPCKYVVEGIELVPFGFAVVKQTAKFYEFVIYDGNISLSEMLEGKKLNDLDWSLYNHNLNFTNYLGSFTNTSGYIYVKGRYVKSKSEDKDNYYASLDNNLDLQSPSFFIHTLFDMIITQNGHTWSGDISTDQNFLKCLTSVESGHNQVIVDGSPSEEFNGGYYFAPYSQTSTMNPFEDTNVIASWTTGTGWSNQVSVVGTWELLQGTSAYLEIKIGAAIITSKNIFSQIDLNELISFSCPPSSAVQLTIRSYSFDAGASFVVSYNIDVGMVATAFGDRHIAIDFSEIIGETTQLAFMKDIMQKFGLMFQKRAFSNHYDFVKTEDLFSDRANSEDWTDKIIELKKTVYKPPYAKTNIARYKYDTDIEPFADGVLEIDNDVVKYESTLFTSIFKASSLAGFYPAGRFQLYHWTHEAKVEDEVEYYEFLQTKDSLRFFNYEMYAGDTITYRFSDDSNTQQFTGDVPRFTMVDADFQFFLDTYYTKIKIAFDKFKLKTFIMHLDLLDIFNLDFKRLKYDKNTGKYYYLSKISNHKPSTLTNVELIEV